MGTAIFHGLACVFFSFLLVINPASGPQVNSGPKLDNQVTLFFWVRLALS